MIGTIVLGELILWNVLVLSVSGAVGLWLFSRLIHWKVSGWVILAYVVLVFAYGVYIPFALSHYWVWYLIDLPSFLYPFPSGPNFG
jgi:hypothetical protein